MVREFEIYNAARRSRKSCATLVYDEIADEMFIDIDVSAKPEDLPLMLGLFVEQGKFTVPDEWTRRWVRERVPPSSRQNMGEILRAQGLEEYDEMALLAAAEGRSAQDDFLIREVIEDEPGEVIYAVVEFEGDEAEPQESTPSWCALLGAEIAQRRRDLGMTQRELAERTGIDQAQISRIEQGRATPTIDTLEALAKGVGRALLIKLV